MWKFICTDIKAFRVKRKTSKNSDKNVYRKNLRKLNIPRETRTHLCNIRGRFLTRVGLKFKHDLPLDLAEQMLIKSILQKHTLRVVT